MQPPPEDSAQAVSVAIVGAGLTGLSAALTLEEEGVDWQLFERLGWVGGHAITVEEDGYRFDRTGHLLHLRDATQRARVQAWLQNDFIEVQRQSRVWSHGVYTRYPFQANTYGLPPEVALDCVMGFVEAQQRPPERAPQNFEEFCLATFGAGISQHFMLPYNARLWGVEPSDITSDWCQRFVPQPSLRDVLAGAVGLNDRELGYNANFIYPRRGIGELPKRMLEALGSDDSPARRRLHLNQKPLRINAGRRELEVGDQLVRYEQLISTAPLDTLLSLIEDLPSELREAQQQLRCTHLYYLDVALNVPCGKNVHWVYVPEAKYPFYRVGCYSHFSPEMAPPGKACLYVELANREEPDLTRLLPEVAKGLKEMQLINAASDIRFARVRRIDHAYVIFDHHYFASTNAVFPFLEQNGIYSTGRYGGWNYSSMEDALIFGTQGARRAIGQLTRRLD